MCRGRGQITPCGSLYVKGTDYTLWSTVCEGDRLHPVEHTVDEGDRLHPVKQTVCEVHPQQLTLELMGVSCSISRSFSDRFLSMPKSCKSETIQLES